MKRQNWIVKINCASTCGWNSNGPVEKNMNGTEERKQGHFNEVMAVIMLSRALCLHGHGCVSFLAVWECIAICFWRDQPCLLAWLKPLRKTGSFLSHSTDVISFPNEHSDSRGNTRQPRGCSLIVFSGFKRFNGLSKHKVARKCGWH